MTITAHPPSQHRRHQQEGRDVLEAARRHGTDPFVSLALGGAIGRAGEASPVLARDLPCQVNDADLWFAELPQEVEQAKALCLGCPVREACLAGALQRREPWGVWGGQLVLQGVVVPRKRPRGRPRKSDVAA